MQHAETQLAARVEEMDNVRHELAMMAAESEEWRAKGVALSAQLDGASRAADAAKARVKVLENVVQLRDDDARVLKQQVAALMDSRCTPLLQFPAVYKCSL